MGCCDVRPFEEGAVTFKGVIFDLDGTLVNSLEDLADCMNHVLRDHGFRQHSVEEYKNMIGNGIRRLVYESLAEGDRRDELVSECYDSMMNEYRANCTTKTRPYSGIADLLKHLFSRGINLAVLSNKADELTRKVVSTLLPEAHFGAIIGSSDKWPRKPDPSGALEIVRRFQLDPEDFVYVGDTDVDMQTANRAGMYAVGALWGFRTKEELLANGAKYILNRPADLIDLL